MSLSRYQRVRYPQAHLTIIADAEWLVCREECIPETGQFSLDVSESSDGAIADTQTHGLFDQTRAQLPQAETVIGRYRLDGDTIKITIDSPGLIAADPTDIWFAASQWGPVDASGKQGWVRTTDELVLSVPAGDMPPNGDRTLDGLLVVELEANDTTVRRGYQTRLVVGSPLVENGALGFWTALVFALVGGLILNVMPCVLPVLGIKILGFTRDSGTDRRRLAVHGLIYGAGVLISFALLAAVLLIARSGGASLGWGFQLQSPVLVTLLAYLMLLVGLNLAGVFSIGGGLMGAGQSLTAASGRLNTFATGVLAAVVASPCTAPFMGAALGFTITRPPWEALTVFLALGAGFALPVLLLSLFPAWLGFIPTPGGWMKRFQQVLAFPMFATAAWLLWVLSQQTDAAPTAPLWRDWWWWPWPHGYTASGIPGVGVSDCWAQD